MGRFDRGGTLKNAHTRAIVLSCAFVASLLFSSNTHALTVEPIVDRVISVAKLNESEGSSTNDGRRGSTKDKTTPAQPSANKATDMTSSPLPSTAVASEPAIVVEPMEQLPTIDSADVSPQTIRMSRPVSTLTVSQAVLGVTTTDSLAPLQASDHGWKFFGVAWYWWLLACFAIFAVFQMLKRAYSQQRTHYELPE